MTIRKTTSILLATFALTAIVILGIRSQSGFSQEQLAQLELDWTELESWAQVSRPGPIEAAGQGLDLAQAIEDWHMATEAQQAAEALRQDCLGLLRQDLYRFDWSSAPQPLGLFQFGETLWSADRVDSQQVADTLQFARCLQREGHLLHFLMGLNLARKALDACDADPSLVPLPRPITAPKRGDLFAAMCRDHLFAQAQTLQLVTGLTVDSDSPQGSGEELLPDLIRAAYVCNAQLYYPLREDPERFGEVPLPKKPGQLDLFISWLLQRPEDHLRTVESLLTFRMDHYGTEWAQLVRDWERVLGS